MASWVADTDGGIVLQVRVIPRARRSSPDGLRNDSLLVRLASAPVDGAANAALVELLASLLGVSRRAVRIVGGERSRDKRVEVLGLNAQQVRTRLGID